MDGEGKKIPCCVAFSVLYPIGKHVFGQISIMFQLGRCGCALGPSAVSGDLKLSSLFLLLDGGGGSVGGGANVFLFYRCFTCFRTSQLRVSFFCEHANFLRNASVEEMWGTYLLHICMYVLLPAQERVLCARL